MSEPAYVCMECARTTSGRCVQHSYVSMPKQDILSECGALRKRVEELEEHRKELIELVDSRTRGWREAAEKAERERDEARASVGSYQACAHNYVEKHKEVAKLQADLDAALMLCVESDWDVRILGEGYEREIYDAHTRILTLLAARKEEKREEGVLSGRAEQRPERAWLIESRFTPAPTWWTGTDHPAPWTRDSLKAVRFCRKCDAEAAMAALQDGHFCLVSEHQWGLGAPDCEAEAKLPLGHPYSVFVDGDEGRPCTATVGSKGMLWPCGQPRSAHEPM